MDIRETFAFFSSFNAESNRWNYQSYIEILQNKEVSKNSSVGIIELFSEKIGQVSKKRIICKDTMLYNSI